VRGVLEKYSMQELDFEVVEDVLRDLESVLYDEMIFDRIIQEVDRSYAVGHAVHTVPVELRLVRVGGG